MIYFVQELGAGFIKIGFSSDLEKVAGRVATLQTSSPHLLRLLKVIPGELVDETALHHRFQTLRVNGEWFYPGQELLEFIDVSDVLIPDDVPPLLANAGSSFMSRTRFQKSVMVNAYGSESMELKLAVERALIWDAKHPDKRPLHETPKEAYRRIMRRAYADLADRQQRLNAGMDQEPVNIPTLPVPSSSDIEDGSASSGDNCFETVSGSDGMPVSECEHFIAVELDSHGTEEAAPTKVMEETDRDADPPV